MKLYNSYTETTITGAIEKIVNMKGSVYAYYPTEGADYIAQIISIGDKIFLVSLDQRFPNRECIDIIDAVSWLFDKQETIIFIDAISTAGLLQFLFTIETICTTFEAEKHISKSDAIGMLKIAGNILGIDSIPIGNDINLLPTKKINQDPFFKVPIQDELGNRTTYTSDVASMATS